MRKSDFLWLTIMELHFDAILYSNLSDENSDVDHIKCSRWPQVPTPLDEYPKTRRKVIGRLTNSLNICHTKAMISLVEYGTKCLL